MTQRLECRIILRYRRDRRVDMGMYDPKSGRYEALGTHGPDKRDVDKAVHGLMTAIERAGHRLTWAEHNE